MYKSSRYLDRKAKIEKLVNDVLLTELIVFEIIGNNTEAGDALMALLDNPVPKKYGAVSEYGRTTLAKAAYKLIQVFEEVAEKEYIQDKL